MSKVDNKARSICIVGMGYVGTSLAAVLAESGYRVYGVDIDSETVRIINDGTSPIAEQRITERFERYATSGRITASESYDVVEEAEICIVTVGTPLDGANPDLSGVNEATRRIGSHLSAGDIVIYRSTLPAGATEETLVPALIEESGMTPGDEFAVGFCPERMAEGSAYDDLTSLPVVVGGATDACRERIESFWNDLGQETIAVSSPTAAELTKLADNWWIDLNIALANELALLAERLDVDVLEVIQAANTLPKGEHTVNVLFPGAGVGGSCLVKDPRFVADLGESLGLDLQTPRISRTVNERMPEHVVGLVEGALGGLTDARVGVLGYAFKGGTDDTRNTPAKPIVEQLRRHGADVRVTDPHVSPALVREEIGQETVPFTDAIADADALVVVTGHERYRDLSPGELTQMVGSDEYVLVDGRHVFDPSDFDDSEVHYLGVGRGNHG